MNSFHIYIIFNTKNHWVFFIRSNISESELISSWISTLFIGGGGGIGGGIGNGLTIGSVGGGKVLLNRGYGLSNILSFLLICGNCGKRFVFLGKINKCLFFFFFPTLSFQCFE